MDLFFNTPFFIPCNKVYYADTDKSVDNNGGSSSGFTQILLGSFWAIIQQ